LASRWPGKTGTTDDYRDAIFMGFSPDLVVGVRVGFDDNRTLGEGEAGGSVAAPIFTEFMEKALADQAAIPFRIPPGVRLVKIDARTGELPGPDTSVIIDEAFRPGTEPGLSAFNGSDDCLSISGSCGTGSSSGSVSVLTPNAMPVLFRKMTRCSRRSRLSPGTSTALTDPDAF
jgi:penicillin-binding protein 1A